MHMDWPTAVTLSAAFLSSAAVYCSIVWASVLTPAERHRRRSTGAKQDAD